LVQRDLECAVALGIPDGGEDRVVPQGVMVAKTKAGKVPLVFSRARSTSSPTRLSIQHPRFLNSRYTL